MTSLHSVLANRQAGVFRYEGNARAALERLSGPAPRHVRVVGPGGKRGLLDALAGALEFPPHFGGNWDALYDCLTDLDLAGKPGLVLEIAGLSRFAREDPRELTVGFGTFGDAARFWAERHACFVVLIGGAGRVASALAPIEG